jgi:hypothetical protein
MISGKTRNQTNINRFFDFEEFDNLSTTSGTNFHFEPAYSCSCKKGYSPFSDPYTWRRPEEPEDCSRADIKKACRLGKWY